MDITNYRRSFDKPVEQLHDLFFQILLHEFNSYKFSINDWSDFTLSYGQLFFRFESIWTFKATRFIGQTRTEISEFLTSNPIEFYNKRFEDNYHQLSKLFHDFKYNLDEGYPDLIDLDTFTIINDTQSSITDIFTSLKGGFPVINPAPSLWAFNAIDIELHLELFTEISESLFIHFIELELTMFLNSFVEYGETENFQLYHSIKGEKEAVIKELSLNPALLSSPIDRIIYLIDLKYRKQDDSSLNKETIRRTVNRMKSTPGK